MRKIAALTVGVSLTVMSSIALAGGTKVIHPSHGLQYFCISKVGVCKGGNCVTTRVQNGFSARPLSGGEWCWCSQSLGACYSGRVSGGVLKLNYNAARTKQFKAGELVLNTGC